jgi:hypothetical protein
MAKIHSHDSMEAMLRHIRDDKSLQFFATSGFESEEEDSWKGDSLQIAEFNEEDRFVAIQGFQWLGEVEKEGLRQFIYAKEGKPLLRKKDSKNNALKKIFKSNNPKEMLAIPMMTMGKETSFDFVDFNPEFEKVVEIYNALGSSECTTKEGNLKPLPKEHAEGSMIRALNRGCRFGFIAGGWDSRGIFEKYKDQESYTPGLTAILAKEHNRSSLVEALQARSCYATTGERIVLGFSIAGFGMGSEVDTKSRPGVEFNRHIVAYAIGTAPLAEIALIRNGKVFRTFESRGDQWEIALDDMDSLGSIVLEREGATPFAYYYLRVRQTDGHMAWSSPIWIDMNAQSAPINSIKKLKKKSSSTMDDKS